MLVLIACVGVILRPTTVDARPNGHHSLSRPDPSNELFAKHSRRNYCVDAAGKCFSSGQCCRGLVCAAIDDYFGQKPEVPGYCVKEKDLEVCVTNADCGPFGRRCVALGRTGERYCLPRPSRGSDQVVDEMNDIAAAAAAVKPAPAAAAAAALLAGLPSGGLGSSCTTNGDCLSKMIGDSGDRLCCQDVRRGRQGVRRICDRVTTISVCIDSP